MRILQQTLELGRRAWRWSGKPGTMPQWIQTCTPSRRHLPNVPTPNCTR